MQVLFLAACKQQKVIMPANQKNSQHSPPLSTVCLCSQFGTSAVRIIHPDVFWKRKPPETSMLSFSLNEQEAHPKMCRKVWESLSLTGSSSDTECPPDSDACYVQNRGSWGTAGTMEGEGKSTRGSGQLQNQLSDSLRFKKSTARQQLHGPRCRATTIPLQWKSSHTDLTLCDLTSKWPLGKEHE